MWQTRVAALASLVPAEGGNLAQLGCMTRRARAPIGGFANEIMRRVAALAGNARVKIGIFGGGLMTRAAGTRPAVHRRAARVRVMAAHAGAHHALLRMIGVLILMTPRASLLRSPLHVVGRVAIRALLVTRGSSAAQDHEVGMTRAARRRLFFGEFVRAMATHARAVPGLEQRRGGHDRLLARVARDTRR